MRTHAAYRYECTDETFRTQARAEVVAFPLPAESDGLVSFSQNVGDWRKRAFDIAFTSSLILLLSPFFLFVMAIVKLSSPGKCFYGHERIGRNGRRFRCLKFRTMVINGDEVLSAHLEKDPTARQEWAASRKLRMDPRITRIGHVLRKTSVDELPQLINVLRGEMSLVGPRPVVSDELSFYGSRRVHYLAARPGLTGLWQVSGRSDTSYEQRVGLDCHYVENWSFLSDLILIVRTIPAVISRRGTY